MVPEGVNSKCGAAIRNFYRKENPSFRDFMNLKVFGRDCFSSMDKEGAVRSNPGKGKFGSIPGCPRGSFLQCHQVVPAGAVPRGCHT